ncbi:MAG: putative ABC transport system permease protein [Alteromonadaceae bacterium]|jgi:putative ABC transport system permease protein
MKSYHKLSAILITAIEALKENTLRTLLSLSGIMIGIASIVLVLSINDSGRELIFKELETFGLRSVWISRDMGDYYTNKENFFRGSGLFDSDYKYIKTGCCPSLLRISPIVNLIAEGEVSIKGRNIRSNVIGVNESFDLINNEDLVLGRFFTLDDIKKDRFLTVITQDVAKILLESGTKSILGAKIKIHTNWFTVIGVLGNKSRDFISSIGANKGNATLRILAPYTTIQKTNGNIRDISYFQAQAKEIDLAPKAVDEIKRYLSYKYKNIYKYKGETMVQYIETANNILKNISLVGLVTALVSLIVGGLAVLNVMFMSVVERTREIGIRKSVGAKNRDILSQFISESILITAIGGGLGVILAYSIIYLITFLYPFDVAVSSFGVLSALISTISIGMISGLYPAIKAANLKPVESLRYD